MSASVNAGRAGVNLIPMDIQAEASLRKYALRWVLLAALVVAGLLAGYSVMRTKSQRMSADVDALRVQVESMSHWENEIPALVDQLHAASAQWQAASQLQDEPDWPALLGDIAGAAGTRILLGDLSASREERAAGAKPAATAALSGFAQDSTELVAFMTRLSETPSIKSLGLDLSRQGKEEGGGNSWLEFKLKLMPR